MPILYVSQKAAVRKLREDYLEEKKRAIQAKDDVIQKLEKKERDTGDKSTDKINSQNYVSELNYVSAELNINESNFSKQKLNDYEEAFRRIFV